MGCDTKGVVVTSFKDPFKASSLIERALNTYITTERELRFPGRPPFDEAAQGQFRDVNIGMRPESGHLQVSFVFEGETRMMSVFFDCDRDYKALGDKKIILALNCFGRSEHLMKRALHALSLMGTAYYVYNDCSGEFSLLDEYRPTLLQAVKLGYIRDCYFEDWLEPLRAVVPTAKLLAGKVGVSSAALKKLLSLADEDARWEQVKTLVAQTSAPPLQCVLDYEEEMAHRQDAGEIGGLAASACA